MIVQNLSSTNQAQSADVRPAHVNIPKLAVRAPVAEARPTPEQVQRAVDAINIVLQQSNRDLQFSIDPDTSNPVVRVMDATTGEVIRQFPSKESLAIARAIDRLQQGLLLSEEA